MQSFVSSHVLLLEHCAQVFHVQSFVSSHVLQLEHCAQVFHISLSCVCVLEIGISAYAFDRHKKAQFEFSLHVSSTVPVSFWVILRTFLDVAGLLELSCPEKRSSHVNVDPHAGLRLQDQERF